MLVELTKWLNLGQVTDALQTASDREAWKIMITYANEQGT